MSDPYPHWLFDESPIDDPAIFKTSSGEMIGGGERAVRFMRALWHPVSGKPFQLDPWQERLVRRMYGPRHPDGTKIVRETIMMVPRGGRKTTFGSALSLLHTIGPEKVRRGQVILAAYDREQARVAYDEAVGIVSARRETAAAARIRDFVHEIKHVSSGTTLKAISSDADSQNGKTPSFALIDEIHVWKKRALYDTIHTGLSKTKDTMKVVISQAGRGRETLAAEVFDFARKVASGLIDNPAILPVLFETPADADWRDEAVWHRVNPGLKYGYPDLDSFRTDAQQAEERPAMREKFKNDKLNIWIEGRSDPWLDLSIYDEGGEPFDIAEREGEDVWIGVDLGSTNDLTAVVMALRDPDGGFTIVPHVFAPEDSLRPRQDRGEAPYVDWRNAGLLTATPGASTDFDIVEDHIRQLCGRFNVKEVAFDPWSARAMMTRLRGEGIEAVEHRQGFRSFNEPMREFERAVLDRRLRHGGHAVLRWCIGNVAIDKDPAGNIKPNKGRSQEKIDAAVAAVMAIGRAAANELVFNPYADPDFDVSAIFGAS